MKKITALLLCICAITVNCFIPAASAESLPLDLLIDFESDTNIKNCDSAAGTAEIISGVGFSGSRSLKLSGNSNRANLNVNFNDISLKAGKSYKISFKYKSAVSAWGYLYDSGNSKLGIDFKVSDKWQTVEKNIDCTSNSNYLNFGTVTPENVLYIDDLSVKETHNITVTSNDVSLGTAKSSVDKSAGRETVVFNAYPEYGCGFSGWQDNNGNIVSLNAEYGVCDITADLNLKAIFFKKQNGIQEIDFEEKTPTIDSGVGEIEYVWGNSSVHSGNGAVKLKHNSTKNNLSVNFLKITLEQNTAYEVTFYYKTNKNLWMYADSPSNGSFTESAEWTLYKKTITPDSNKGYLQIGFTTPDAELMIDDLKVKRFYDFKAETQNSKNGNASVDIRTAAYGETVTFSADANYGYYFCEWKDSYGKTVSTSREYKVSVLDDLILTAIFKKNVSNDIKIDFESDINKKDCNSLAGTAEITSETSFSGNRSLKLASNSNRANLNINFNNVTLKAGENYKITFKYKSALKAWGYLYNSGDSKLGIDFKVSEEWQSVEKIVYCASNCDYLNFGTVAPDNVLYIDDLEIKKIYNVTVVSNNEAFGKVSLVGQNFTYGDTAKLSAIGSSGYALADYTYENGKVLSDNPNYEFVVYDDIKITAVFERRCDSDKHRFYLSELKKESKSYICEDCGYSYIVNDVNGDKKIDICDFTLEELIVNGKSNYYNAFSADCNEDGKIDETDLETLRKVLLGITDFTYDAPLKQRRSFDYGFSGNNYLSWSNSRGYNNSSGSLYIDGSKIKQTAFYSLPSMFVKPYTEYTVSAFVYGVSCPTSIQLNLSEYDEYSYISGNLATYSGNWNKLSLKFKTGNIKTNTITPVLVINVGNKFYFDELTLDEVVYNGTYSEKFYNLVKGGDFETNEFIEKTPENVSIAEDKRAVSGTHLLSCNQTAFFEKTYVLNQIGKYRFALSYIAPKDSSFEVEITYGESKYLITSETCSVFNRKSFDFVVKDSKTTVTVSFKTNGNILFEDIYLFLCGYAFEKNPNVYNKSAIVPDIRSALLHTNPSAKLAVNSNNCVQSDYLGNTGIYYAFNYIPEKYERKYTDEMQSLELQRIKNAGVSIVRTQYSPCWAWNTKTNKWDYETEEMQGFYKYLDDMKAYGIDVAIQIGWDISDITSSRLTSYNFNPFYILSGGDSTKAENCYAEWVSNSVKALHSKGYDNVKYLVAFTEPSTALTTEDYTRDIEIWKRYVMLAHNKMTVDGVRDSVKILGFNMGAYNRKTSPVDDFLALKYMAKDSELLSAVDIFTYHIYVTTENTADNYPEWYHYMSEAAKIASSVGKKLWFDEGEWISSDDTDWNEKASYGIYGTQLALKTVAAMNSGLQTSMRWTITDQYWTNLKNTNSAGEWQNGCHLDGLLPNLNSTSIPRKSYYAYSLIGKYTSGMKNVYSGTNDGSLYITSCSDGKGRLTVIVVNMGNASADFSVSGISSFNVNKLYRHIYDCQNIIPDSDAEIINADTVIEGISDKFTDSLPKYSFAVYTTIG